MTEAPTTVIVTGASTFLGGYLCTRLAANSEITRIIAVDSRTPSKDMLRRMGRTEFITTDIRRPGIAKIIEETDADTVVHAATSVLDTAGHSAATKDLTIMGAMQVFAACQQSETVKRVVLRSSAMVYGTSSGDPAYFAENDLPVGELVGYGKDLADVEGYARGLARRRPDITVSILRLSAILGPHIHTRMSMYFSNPVVPVVIGREPRFQFLHEEDALGALERATMDGPSGIFNVAGDGVVTASQVLRRAGRISVPVPAGLLSPASSMLSGLLVRKVPADQVGYLTFGRVLDTQRMRTELDFTPSYSTLETVDDFITRRALEPVISPRSWTQGAAKFMRVRATNKR